MNDKFVDCDTHGDAKMAFVCHHFLKKENIGWNEKEEYVFDENNDLWDCISAWCDKCESYRVDNDGWDEKSEKFADIQLICENCELKYKQANLKLRFGDEK